MQGLEKAVSKMLRRLKKLRARGKRPTKCHEEEGGPSEDGFVGDRKADRTMADSVREASWKTPPVQTKFTDVFGPFKQKRDAFSGEFDSRQSGQSRFDEVSEPDDDPLERFRNFAFRPWASAPSLLKDHQTLEVASDPGSRQPSTRYSVRSIFNMRQSVRTTRTLSHNSWAGSTRRNMDFDDIMEDRNGHQDSENHFNDDDEELYSHEKVPQAPPRRRSTRRKTMQDGPAPEIPPRRSSRRAKSMKHSSQGRSRSKSSSHRSRASRRSKSFSKEGHAFSSSSLSDSSRSLKSHKSSDQLSLASSIRSRMSTIDILPFKRVPSKHQYEDEVSVYSSASFSSRSLKSASQRSFDHPLPRVRVISNNPLHRRSKNCGQEGEEDELDYNQDASARDEDATDATHSAGAFKGRSSSRFDWIRRLSNGSISSRKNGSRDGKDQQTQQQQRPLSNQQTMEQILRERARAFRVHIRISRNFA